MGMKRRIAIGDIHGCYYTFKALLEELKPNKQDDFFLLGDCIGKGLHSDLVLDLLLDLSNKQYRIHLLKGNHEERLLMAYANGFSFFEHYLTHNNLSALLEGEVDQYLNFIGHSPYFIELEDVFLSHAGIEKGGHSLYRDIRGMFASQRLNINEQRVLQKRQLHGHIVHTLEQITQQVTSQQMNISLDGGCYLNDEKYGRLVALDIDNMELYSLPKKNNDR